MTSVVLNQIPGQIPLSWTDILLTVAMSHEQPIIHMIEAFAAATRALRVSSG